MGLTKNSPWFEDFFSKQTNKPKPAEQMQYESYIAQLCANRKGKHYVIYMFGRYFAVATAFFRFVFYPWCIGSTKHPEYINSIKSYHKHKHNGIQH